MKLFRSKIDNLASEKRQLTIKIQNTKDKMHEKNSAIETKLKKLENKAQFLKEVADKKCVEFERRIQKINRDIESEQIYVNSVANSEIASETKKYGGK